jgi:predicted PurR-regulated permease PerM
MNEINHNIKLTRQDWFWIAFVAILSTIVTFGGFIIFSPAYVLALFCGYLVTCKFNNFFDRKHRSLFVIKVLIIVLPIFIILCWLEILMMPSVYEEGINLKKAASVASVVRNR